jgi:hypothetical protein
MQQRKLPLAVNATPRHTRLAMRRLDHKAEPNSRAEIVRHAIE